MDHAFSSLLPVQEYVARLGYPVEVGHSDAFGRGLLATRKINQGDTVLRERDFICQARDSTWDPAARKLEAVDPTYFNPFASVEAPQCCPSSVLGVSMMILQFGKFAQQEGVAISSFRPMCELAPEELIRSHRQLPVTSRASTRD